MCIFLLFQVTIRASLTGKTHILPVSPDRSGLVVSTETQGLNHLVKPPGVVAKSKSNVSAAGRGKERASQNKKQDGRPAKHNLALRNLRLLIEFSLSTAMFTRVEKIYFSEHDLLLLIYCMEIYIYIYKL